jgi:hypothetical protein
MKIEPFTIKARVWEWEGKGAWHFVTIDKKTSKQIKDEYIFPKRGFGSIPVNVRIKSTRWKTSIFPEKEGTSLLPLKRSVREEQEIKKGDTIEFELELIL